MYLLYIIIFPLILLIMGITDSLILYPQLINILGEILTIFIKGFFILLIAILTVTYEESWYDELKSKELFICYKENKKIFFVKIARTFSKKIIINFICNIIFVYLIIRDGMNLLIKDSVEEALERGVEYSVNLVEVIRNTVNNNFIIIATIIILTLIGIFLSYIEFCSRLEKEFGED